MAYAVPLLTLAVVHLLAVVSPGPSFVVVSGLALSGGRRPALAAAIGMGVGAVVWAAAAIVGLAFVLQYVGWLYALLKVAGGLYLLFLAGLLWRQKVASLGVQREARDAPALTRAFRSGLLTQLSNPKVAVFFGSIFFALLPSDPQPWVYAFCLAIIFINETGWYALVALTFSIERPRSAYLRMRRYVDRVMAGVLGLMGGRLIWEALSPAR
jgi:threonine/homoserine/homoserine lactone efflux protein